MSDTILPVEYINVFEKDLLQEINDKGTVKTFAEGDILMELGQYIKTLPILVKGSIKIVREDDDGHDLFLYYVRAKETCAMSLTCCMRDQKSQIRAIAEEPVEVVMLPVEYMDEWMMKYRTWKNFVMTTYSVRFEELLNTIDLIAFHNMDERLIEYLKEKSEIHNTNNIEVTHQQIAFDLSSSREAISRLLKKLEKMGKLSLHRNRIELK